MSVPNPTLVEPDLKESFRSLPTEDELPCDDGEPMETARHRDQMILLIESLKAHWTDREDYYVGGNMFIHYNPLDKHYMRGPDFFLVLDTDPHERKSWVVWQEGMRFPDVIIELLSDSTREVDRGAKKRLYARVFRTAEYYLYDPFSCELEGFHLLGADYRPTAPDPGGRIFSSLTGMYLAVRDGWLRWLNKAGEVLPTPAELARRAMSLAEQEKQRADRERQRAEEAETLLEAYRKRFGDLK
jgi:Uma2 family endonuclease